MSIGTLGPRRILVIADQTTCLAFALGGIATRSVKAKEEAQAAFAYAVQNPEIGLVMITERIAAVIRSEVDTVNAGQHRPLVVEIPDTAGPLPGRPSVREIMVSLMGPS